MRLRMALTLRSMSHHNLNYASADDDGDGGNDDDKGDDMMDSDDSYW